jgi:hypothetical protein
MKSSGDQVPLVVYMWHVSNLQIDKSLMYKVNRSFSTDSQRNFANGEDLIGAGLSE